MNGRCETDPFDSAVDVCDSCYGEFCESCLVHPKGRRYPTCTECTLFASGVRHGGAPERKGSRRSSKKRRAALKQQETGESKFFEYFDADSGAGNAPAAPDTIEVPAMAEVGEVGEVGDQVEEFATPAVAKLNALRKKDKTRATADSESEASAAEPSVTPTTTDDQGAVRSEQSRPSLVPTTADTAHADTAHADTAHADTAHADTAHAAAAAAAAADADADEGTYQPERLADPGSATEAKPAAATGAADRPTEQFAGSEPAIFGPVIAMVSEEEVDAGGLFHERRQWWPSTATPAEHDRGGRRHLQDPAPIDETQAASSPDSGSRGDDDRRRPPAEPKQNTRTKQKSPLRKRTSTAPMIGEVRKIGQAADRPIARQQQSEQPELIPAAASVPSGSRSPSASIGASSPSTLLAETVVTDSWLADAAPARPGSLATAPGAKRRAMSGQRARGRAANGPNPDPGVKGFDTDQEARGLPAPPAEGERRDDFDADNNWIPPILRGMAPDAREAKENLPQRRQRSTDDAELEPAKAD